MRKTADTALSRIIRRSATIALALGLGAVAIQLAKAQSLTVVYNFVGPPDGAKPFAGVIMDKEGNLYGTTIQGGVTSNDCSPNGCGTVFKLETEGNETLLHSFTEGIGQPFAGVIMDKEGNLYGTTSIGGIYSNGTVFKIDTAGNQTLLHSFATGESDGIFPAASLIMDKAGNLYGTTVWGGSSNNCLGGCGTVFKVDTSGNETVLHSFAGTPDGEQPYASLIMDKAGNLYGTTVYGGSSSNGTVFKLDSLGNESVLYSFTNSDGDGGQPFAPLIMDKKGNLYGTTKIGGTAGKGTVFKIDTAGNETVLHSFTGGSDGEGPLAGLLMDKAGNFYGTTLYGGGTNYLGTVFRLDTSGHETVLHGFTGADGGFPVYGNLVVDKSGNLYGTTSYGGTHLKGTVFKLTP